MGDLSKTFDPSSIATAASQASSAMVAVSDASDVASSAMDEANTASAAAASAASQATVALSKAVAASSAAATNMLRLPDPAEPSWATPVVKNKSSQSGSISIDQPLTDGQTNIYLASFPRAGQKITLTGDGLGKVSFYLKKTGVPTGTLYVRVRKASNDEIIETSATELDVSTLGTDFAWKHFVLTCAPNEEVYITCEFEGGDGSNYVVFADYEAESVCEGCLSYYHDSWMDQAEDDATWKLWGAGTYADDTVDEDIATFWSPSPENEAGAWISWDIGSIKYIGGCRIYWGSEEAYRPTEYKIYTSPDNSEWTEVVHETEAAPASAWKTYKWYAKYARYIKLIVTTHGASGTKIYEVDGYSKTDQEAFACHGHGGL